jgi:hypothetical protein
VTYVVVLGLALLLVLLLAGGLLGIGVVLRRVLPPNNPLQTWLERERLGLIAKRWVDNWESLGAKLVGFGFVLILLLVGLVYS